MDFKNCKPKILIITDSYYPGYKAGGPIRSLIGIIDKLGDEFQFKVLTADRDFGDNVAYTGIKVNEWNKVGKTEVIYINSKRCSLSHLKYILCSTECDVIYLNSYFSYNFTIKPLILMKFGQISHSSVVISPRGEFSIGALKIKKIKKRTFIYLAKLIGLYRGVTWHASSYLEENDIRKLFGNDVPVVIAPNISPLINPTENVIINKNKQKGFLKIIFLSRISRKKNLDGALNMLFGLKGHIQFNIYGPIEDKIYWTKCKEIIKNLPKNIEVCHYNGITHDQVTNVFKKHDLFFLPTHGENFGHVILEALCSGCPVLISDQTPWIDLEKVGVGWHLPLTRPDLFTKELQRCVDMDNDQHTLISLRALQYGCNVAKDEKTVELNRQLFRNMMKT
jgi:glycosyltransferase involved in cell wall biosynthesis